MIKSMTGYGRGEFSDGKRNIIAEIKTVNHRYSDLNIRMPKRYSFAEELIKSEAKKVIKRGKGEISVIVENITEEDINIRLNSIVAQQYIENLKELKDKFDIDGEIDLQLIATLPEVMKSVPDVENEDEISETIVRAVRQAADGLDRMRCAEGERLCDDVLMRGSLIRDIVSKISDRAPQIADIYTEKLKNRIMDLIGDVSDVSEERILMEAAIFADKSNITEELVRLDSHLEQLDAIIKGATEPVGKKLDFLVQEMNREANTIGSKANDLEITSLMLETKSEIEKIREQIQNIE